MEKDTAIGTQRLASLFDAGTFAEVGAYIKREDGKASGATCGYGAVNWCLRSRRTATGKRARLTARLQKNFICYMKARCATVRPSLVCSTASVPI